MSHRWTTPIARGSLVAVAAVLVLVTGCSNDTDGSPTPASTTAPPSAAQAPDSDAPASGKAPLTISDGVAMQLCDDIRPQLTHWRVQGPTLGKVTFNATIHDWALRNGALNLRVLADKPVIDRITTKVCPDVRDEAIRALEIPDLAAGVAF